MLPFRANSFLGEGLFASVVIANYNRPELVRRLLDDLASQSVAPAHYEVVVVPAMLVGYRRRGDSMSAGCDTMWRSQAEVLSALAVRQPSLPPAVFQRSSGQFALHLAGVSFWSGDLTGACAWALRARPITLVVAIVPYLIRIFARRLPRRAAPRPRLHSDDGRIDQTSLSGPLIPYDRIYARYWNARKDG